MSEISAADSASPGRKTGGKPAKPVAKKAAKPTKPSGRFVPLVKNPKQRSTALSPDATQQEIDAMRALKRRPKPGRNGPSVDERIQSQGGVDWVLEQVVSGQSLQNIAALADVSIGSLVNWLSRDAERERLVLDARRRMAVLWDEQALALIESAKTPLELQRAQQMAWHLRWRASKMAPRVYGDKVQQEVTGAGGGPIAVQIEFVQPPPRQE